MPVRPAETRITDALRRLRSEPNVWVATASPDGVPHLVPLSLAWDGTSVVVATPATTPTARNVAATGRARASLDSADDVVIVTADAEALPFDGAPAEVVDAYVERVGWDPRDEPGDWVLLRLTPRTVQSWHGVAETDGRTIMSDGAWRGA